MSVDYDLVCHKHKQRVSLCSDGLSGVQPQCDKATAAFSITHRECDLNVIDEHNENCDDYREWRQDNWKGFLNYGIEP